MDVRCIGDRVEVGVGAAVSVMPRGQAGAAVEAELAGARGFLVFLRPSDGAGNWQPREDVILACGEPGERVVSLARFKEMRDDVAVFSKMSPWRPTDTRAHTRYSARLRAAVHAPGEPTEIAGATLDVSLGGMAVLIEADPGVDELRIWVGHGGEGHEVPCRVVESRVIEGGTVLHLQFLELTPGQRYWLARLVEDLRDALEHEQLAS